MPQHIIMNLSNKTKAFNVLEIQKKKKKKIACYFCLNFIFFERTFFVSAYFVFKRAFLSTYFITHESILRRLFLKFIRSFKLINVLMDVLI